MRKITLILLALISFNLFAGDIPKRPNPPKLVNDLAGIFSSSQEQQMEADLRAFSNSTSTQIVVVTVKSLNGYDKASFTYEIGESWGVGNKKFNNGVVLMIKPKEIDGKGETFIATGYGLEGIIPDAVCKRIVEVEMIPWFKKKDYFRGTVSAVKTLKSLALEEYTASQYIEKHKQKGKGFSVLGILFIIMIFFLFKARQVRRYSMANDMTFWAAWALLNQSSHSHGGRFNDFSSGGGSFGGSSGFGGFGGGSFGGGGAGGSW